ncbi:hypothetical protein ACO34A_24125 (plasmid) [Rhizobium sp. ACO-34A]|nr:DUF930 domain-containing protein [Rhizobium sp. ACO-34A]ATN36867.1 hypothetical protein ACO34A_24125 [Rhizobium sp. ACO-34A]
MMSNARAPFCLSTLLLAVAVLSFPSSAYSLDAKVISQLKKLNEADQLEQRCDIEGMEQLHADKVISYTFSRPIRAPIHLLASGAVFRRKGDWYRLSYDCTTSRDHLRIEAFRYAEGARIPRKDWPSLYLYP